jgi:predicted nucleic acid-binding protein
MTGVDCNILVQLAFGDHLEHAKTAAVVAAEIAHGSDLVVPVAVATEFLHVITDARRITPPLSMQEAITWLERMVERGVFRLMDSPSESLGLTLRWMRKFNLGRKGILDTHIAAVLHTAGAHRFITSNPSDFKIFDVFEIVTP